MVVEGTVDKFDENKRHLNTIVMIRELTDELNTKLNELKEPENAIDYENRRKGFTVQGSKQKGGIFDGFNPADEQPARSAY